MGLFRVGSMGAAVAVGLVLVVAAVNSGARTAAPVVLSCTAAAGVPAEQSGALCDALAEVLAEEIAQTSPARPFQRGGAVTEEGLLVRLTVIKATSAQITAELYWQQGAHRGTSGPLSSIAVDGQLSRLWYFSLSRNLLKFSDLMLG